MESGSSPDGAGQCVVINGMTTASSDPQSSSDVESLHAEVSALRNELAKKQDLLVQLQDRERQLRERYNQKDLSAL